MPEGFWSRVPTWIIGLALMIAAGIVLWQWGYRNKPIWANGVLLPTDSHLVSGLPAGIIVASTLACADLGIGWTNFEEGMGRFIVGAGNHHNTWFSEIEPTKAIALSIYAPINTPKMNQNIKDSIGGEEAHKLIPTEMPRHQHNSWGEKEDAKEWPYGTASSKQLGNGSPYDFDNPFFLTSPAGGNQPHNNIPPYVALYFCKND